MIYDASATVDYAAFLVEVPQHNNDSSTAQLEEVVRKEAEAVEAKARIDALELEDHR